MKTKICNKCNRSLMMDKFELLEKARNKSGLRRRGVCKSCRNKQREGRLSRKLWRKTYWKMYSNTSEYKEFSKKRDAERSKFDVSTISFHYLVNSLRLSPLLPEELFKLKRLEITLYRETKKLIKNEKS